MELQNLKKELQNFFTDGLLTIIGCGLSCAEGIPGMTDLAAYLQENIPKKVPEKILADWEPISELLNSGKDIETALNECVPSKDLENYIVELTANYFGNAELKIVEAVITGSTILRFTKLLKHMLKPNTGIPVITTNYDRLIEIASEMAGLGVDSMFVGHHVGNLNDRECRLSFCRKVSFHSRRKKVQLTYAKRVLLLKPHGSLDWYLLKTEPVRCPFSLSLPRLIITPGLNKLKAGYERPFDKHRERANEEIDRATRYLIIGYGFNDDHLETHLSSHLKSGRPALVLTRSLSENAKQLIDECDGMIAITAPENTEKSGATVFYKGNKLFYEGPALWDTGAFIEEVLEP